jgi:hypothetical protein
MSNPIDFASAHTVLAEANPASDVASSTKSDSSTFPENSKSDLSASAPRLSSSVVPYLLAGGFRGSSVDSPGNNNTKANSNTNSHTGSSSTNSGTSTSNKSNANPTLDPEHSTNNFSIPQNISHLHPPRRIQQDPHEWWYSDTLLGKCALDPLVPTPLPESGDGTGEYPEIIEFALVRAFFNPMLRSFEHLIADHHLPPTWRDLAGFYKGEGILPKDSDPGHRYRLSREESALRQE